MGSLTSKSQQWPRWLEDGYIQESILHNDTIYSLCQVSGGNQSNPQITGLFIYKTLEDGTPLGRNNLAIVKEDIPPFSGSSWSFNFDNYENRNLFFIRDTLTIICEMRIAGTNRICTMKVNNDSISAISYAELETEKLYNARVLHDRLYYVGYVNKHQMRALFRVLDGKHERIDFVGGNSVNLFDHYHPDSLLLIRNSMNNSGGWYSSCRSFGMDEKYTGYHTFSEDSLELHQAYVFNTQTSQTLLYNDLYFEPYHNPHRWSKYQTLNVHSTGRLMRANLKTGEFIDVPLHDEVFKRSGKLYLNATDFKVIHHESDNTFDIYFSHHPRGSSVYELYVYRINEEGKLLHFTDLTPFIKKYGLYRHQYVMSFHVTHLQQKNVLVSIGKILKADGNEQIMLFAVDSTLMPIADFKRPGCTDVTAMNYDSLAGISDNSCIYTSCRDNQIELNIWHRDELKRLGTAGNADMSIKITGVNDQHIYFDEPMFELCSNWLLGSGVVFSSCKKSVCVPDNGQCYKIDIIDSAGFNSYSSVALTCNFNEDGYVREYVGTDSPTPQSLYLHPTHNFSLTPCTAEYAYRDGNDVMVYPNPAKAQFSISVPYSLTPSYQMRIINMQGLVVKAQNLNQLVTVISVDHLRSGIYIVELTNTNNGSKWLKKVIVL